MAMLAVFLPFVFRIRRSSKRGLRDRDLVCEAAEANGSSCKRRRSKRKFRADILAFGVAGLDPCDPCSFPCNLEEFLVRLSYHANQGFNERASCCPQPYPAKTEPPARRFAGGETRRPTHCPDSAKIPSAKRANHSGSSHRPAGSQRRPQCTPTNQCTDP